MDTLPGYDTWKTSAPEHDGPETAKGFFDCEDCGHEFAAVGDVTEFHPYRAGGYDCAEGAIESRCPECGAVVVGAFTMEPDWDSMADALAERDW